MNTDAAARRVVEEMRERDLTVATCESLTGGLLAAALTSVPGSSEAFRGGFVTYATDLKVSLAGVDAAVVERYGVVSEQVAIAMALGAQRACDADWALATTGVAGPSEVDGHPAGTVWLCVAGPGVGALPPVLYAARHVFPGDREAVRAAAVAESLAMLLRALGE